MRSTTVFGLLILHLMYIYVTPCKVVPLMELMEEDVKIAFNEYKLENGPDITAWPKKFPQLHLKLLPANEQKSLILCGLNYTTYAFRSILNHQEHLNYNKKELLGTLAYILHRLNSHVKICLESVLHTRCEERTEPHPPFPIDGGHSAAKRWGLAALEHSQKFFQELIKLMNKSHAKKE